MRCEAEVRARLHASEAEMRALSDEIRHLTLLVKLGGDGWRDALETLACRIQQRRALSSQLESLRWVLSVESERLAG